MVFNAGAHKGDLDLQSGETWMEMKALHHHGWTVSALAREFGLCVTLALVVTVSIVFFGISAPMRPDAMVLSIALCMAALFAIGLTIAALARTSGAARGLMAAALYPMMFFSGLYYPVQLMPPVIQDISNYTPLGAAVHAIGVSWVGQFPPAQPLLVLAAYALVFGFLAKRFFRWE
ncbi:MAG: ABC transporter permease [Candidatus Dormibacteria bacterium]